MDYFVTVERVSSGIGTKCPESLGLLCRERPGYEDVMALCAAVVGPQQTQVGEAEAEETIGFVYLVKAGRYYKIGRSNSVGRREYELGIRICVVFFWSRFFLPSLSVHLQSNSRAR